MSSRRPLDERGSVRSVCSGRLAQVQLAGRNALGAHIEKHENIDATLFADNRGAKRLEHELNFLNTDAYGPPLPNNVTVQWTKREDDISTDIMLGTQWILDVNDTDGRYTVVVRFPGKYPFEPPYYYVETHNSVLVDLKLYLHTVTESMSDPETKKLRDHVRSEAVMNRMDPRYYSPANTVKAFVSWLFRDDLLTRLLKMAPKFIAPPF